MRLTRIAATALLSIFLLVPVIACNATSHIEPTPTSSHTIVPSSTPTPTLTPTTESTLTPTPIVTATPVPTTSPTPTILPSPTPTPTPTPTYRTSVCGIISSDTTWTAENSPYEITCTIQIPSGVTLTIEPGVTMTMTGTGNMFLLLGTVYAHGTSQELIVFDGGGSTIFGTDPGHGNGDFEYCVFKNGYRLWDRWGQINLRHSQLIDLTPGPSNYSFAEAIIELDGPSGEINIEYNKFINTGGIYSYDNEYGINIRYNLFEGLLSPLCNCGGGTPSTSNQMNVNYNSFIDIAGTILSLEPVFSPTIDATNNYWDTLDTSIIDSKIYDGNDDVRIGSYITYEPILTLPHPDTPE